MEEKKCPECGGLNGGHSDRRCSLMTLEYAQQEIINVEQKWLKVIATMNKNKDVVFNRLKKLIYFNQGKAAILKGENNKLRGKNKSVVQSGAGWVKASTFKYVPGAAYHAKDNLSKGAGKFDVYGQFIWGDGTVTLPRDFESLLILDESPAAAREETEGVKAVVDALTTIYGTMIDPVMARQRSADMLNMANQALCKYDKERQLLKQQKEK